MNNYRFGQREWEYRRRQPLETGHRILGLPGIGRVAYAYVIGALQSAGFDTKDLEPFDRLP